MEETLKAYCKVREASLKMRVWFQPRDILEKTNDRESKSQWFLGGSLEGREKLVEHRGFLGKMKNMSNTESKP